MCEFCCKIGKLEKIKQGAFRGGYYPEKNETQIVEFENVFHLFFGCSDPFMSGIEIEDIKFALSAAESYVMKLKHPLNIS